MPTRRVHHLRGVANENHRDPTDDEPLWVVDVGAGHLQLLRGSEALKELIAHHGLTKTARVYMLSATSKMLGEIAEVEATLEDESDAGATTSEPAAEAARAEAPVAAVEPRAEAARAEAPVAAVEPAAEPARAEAPVTIAKPAAEERASDAEFSLLDRPFDDGEFYEDPPRSRWLRGAGLVALVVLVGAGGYQLLHSRPVAQSPASGREHESTPVAVAAPPTAVPTAAVVVPPPLPAAVAPAAAPATAPPLPTVAPAPAERVLPDAPPSPAPSAQPVVDRVQAPSHSYSGLVAEGQRLFERGLTRRAQTLYEQALAETPDGTAALIGLAYVHLDRGKVQQAIGFFQRALDQDRDNASAVFGLAESHRQKGSQSAALAGFRRFLTLQPTGGEADIARQLVQELENGSAAPQ